MRLFSLSFCVVSINLLGRKLWCLHKGRFVSTSKLMLATRNFQSISRFFRPLCMMCQIPKNLWLYLFWLANVQNQKRPRSKENTFSSNPGLLLHSLTLVGWIALSGRSLGCPVYWFFNLTCLVYPIVCILSSPLTTLYHMPFFCSSLPYDVSIL